MPPERAKIPKRKSPVGGGELELSGFGSMPTGDQSKMKHAVENLTLAIAGVLKKLKGKITR